VKGREAVDGGVGYLIHAFHKAAVKAGAPEVHIHDLRHPFACRLWRAGVDIYTVSKLLRHASVVMSERYAHVAPTDLKLAVEKQLPFRESPPARSVGCAGSAANGSNYDQLAIRVEIVEDAPIPDAPAPCRREPVQAGDIPGKGILAHRAKHLEDAGAIPFRDALKLFFG
jgi:hypothetical protein